MGFLVEIFQTASKDWTRQYQGFTFHGLSPVVAMPETWSVTNRMFQAAARDFHYHIYFVFGMAFPEARPDSLALSHSLWWDDATCPWYRTPDWISHVDAALRQPQRIVANDTNIINWVRATIPDVESKFEFIPNFVDLRKFYARPKLGDPDRFTILFPRRLIPQKGLRETLQVAVHLTEKYSDMEFRFVGGGTSAEMSALLEAVGNRPRIYCESREPDQMPEAYNMADIVLIPTLCAEGTSLSCLEAMACGRPVIAGIAGGLSNLVIHEYNGLLIHVTPDNLIKSILRLYHDPGLRANLTEKGREVAAAHSLTRWRERWSEVIHRCFK